MVATAFYPYLACVHRRENLFVGGDAQYTEDWKRLSMD